MKSSKPDFRAPSFLRAHVEKTMAFYHPRCIDSVNGGFFHFFRDDGSVYDAETRHLVSSTRFVFNYAMAAIHFHEDAHRRVAEHGIEFLRSRHRNPETGGYAWVLNANREAPLDDTNHCYGLAFALLAYATALRAGIDGAGAYLEEAFALMERHFWMPQQSLYRDEISASWSEASPYRGQNANMHACEAMLAAFEATQDRTYLERAATLAERVTRVQAEKSPLNLIWEHYDENWDIDWDYNRSDPKNLFRPWGYQPGHQTEWAKLLLILEWHCGEDWMLPRARFLFDAALRRAWDREHGGICYGFDLEGQICDGDKYFWVQAESLAAAALLAARTGEEEYWNWYDRIWSYAWSHMVDHQYGAWFRILDRENNRYDDLKSPAGKTDDHTMGACYEVLRWLG